MAGALKVTNVFLTGGAQGIGKGIAAGLLQAGKKVVFGDLNPKVGEATEKELGEKYGKDKVQFIPFDVTNGPEFEAAFKTAVQSLNNVDLMVNNAGIMHEGLWDKMIQVNYTGEVRGTYLAYEHMRKDKGGKGGRIINVCSETSLWPSLPNPVYCGTKHAVRAFTSSLALAPDLKELGIQFALLCPGMVGTELVTSVDPSTIRHYEFMFKQAAGNPPPMSSVERIKDAFMKLLNLEDMNGAILECQADYMKYVKMEKVIIGEDWPVEQN